MSDELSPKVKTMLNQGLDPVKFNELVTWFISMGDANFGYLKDPEWLQIKPQIDALRVDEVSYADLDGTEYEGKFPR